MKIHQLPGTMSRGYSGECFHFDFLPCLLTHLLRWHRIIIIVPSQLSLTHPTCCHSCCPHHTPSTSNRFCGLKGHEMFCQVERAYIEDGFNLYGLRACVSNFSDCLDLILDRIGPEDSDDSHLTQSACTLYGLIHARYIVTTHGLDSMYNKVGATAKFFGSQYIFCTR